MSGGGPVGKALNTRLLPKRYRLRQASRYCVLLRFSSGQRRFDLLLVLPRIDSWRKVTSSRVADIDGFKGRIRLATTDKRD